MFDWLSPLVFIQTMARVAVVWLAFYGVGKLIRRPLGIEKAFPLLPSELVGLLAFVILTIPLSLLGVMNRAVCPLILVILAIPGTLFTYGEIRDRLPIPKIGILTLVCGVFMLFVLLLNFANASMPNLAFDDPLITYAVQPDRWLNRGCIYWLEETGFSGFPLFYEMTAVWPASISSDRMNQLSVLQVFQMSMLVIAVFRGMSVMRIRKRLWFPVATVVFLTTLMYIWPAKAKTDSMALLFCTMALASAVRQQGKDFSGSPLSSWLFMGMTLATKQTAIVTVAPFLLYSLKPFGRYPMKWKALALASLVAIPGAYAVRTMLKTGSPTYPVNPVSFMLRDEWELNEPQENITINTRSSYLFEYRNFPLIKHIGVFFAYLEGNTLLFIASIIVLLIYRNYKHLLLAVPVLVYCGLAIIVFWPPWWGVKYATPIIPFTAILGTLLLQDNRVGRVVVYAMVLPAFIIPSFVAVAGDERPFTYRFTVVESILGGNWEEESNYKMWISTPEGMTHMWANSALLPNTVIFSIHEEKRYFFDGIVVVGWRHPLGQKLYEENSLAEECQILDSLSVDFVGFYRGNPAILRQEDRIEILDHIGVGEILEPVIIVDGDYLLCRYNSPSSHQ